MSQKKKFKFQRTDSATAEHCCVPLCQASSKYNKVLSFHTFPTNAETRQKWIVAIRRQQFTISPHTRVCSRHFKKEDVREPWSETGRRLLKKGAVPALFEWNNYSVSLPRPGVCERRERPAEGDTPCKEADTIPEDHDYALAPDADVDLAKVSFFKFPRKDNVRLQRWLLNIRRGCWKPLPWTVYESQQDSLQERPQDSLQEHPQDSLQERPQDSLQEHPQDSLQEHPQDSLQDSLQERPQERPQDSLQERPQERPQDSLQERPQVTVELQDMVIFDHTYCLNEYVFKGTNASGSDEDKANDLLAGGVTDVAILAELSRMSANNLSVPSDKGACPSGFSEPSELVIPSLEATHVELLVCRKRLRNQRERVARLTRKLASLSSTIVELKAKDMITADCVRILLGLLRLPNSSGPEDAHESEDEEDDDDDDGDNADGQNKK